MSNCHRSPNRGSMKRCGLVRSLRAAGSGWQSTDVLEPATGRVISRIGLVGADEVSRSAADGTDGPTPVGRGPISRTAPAFFARPQSWQRLT